LALLSSATPKPASLKSMNRCAAASYIAWSQLVLAWVGRFTTPLAHSNVAV
jgi:hypothetical protein